MHNNGNNYNQGYNNNGNNYNNGNNNYNNQGYNNNNNYNNGNNNGYNNNFNPAPPSQHHNGQQYYHGRKASPFFDNGYRHGYHNFNMYSPSGGIEPYNPNYWSGD